MRKKNFVVHYFWFGYILDGDCWSEPYYHRKSAEKEMNRLFELYKNVSSFQCEVIDYKIWN